MSGPFYNEARTDEPVGRPVEKPPTWAEAFGANWRLNLDDDEAGNYNNKLHAYQDLEDALVEMGQPRARYRNPAWRTFLTTPETAPQRFDMLWRDAQAARARNPKMFADLPKAQADFDVQAFARMGGRARDQRIAERGGFGSAIAPGVAFGLLTAGNSDNIMALPMGGGAKSVAGMIARQFGAGLMTTAVQLPSIARSRENMGEDFTFGEGVQTVAMGGGTNAAFAAGMHYLPKAAARLFGKSHIAEVSDADLAKALSDLPEDMRTPDVEAAIHVLQRQAEVDAVNPHVASPAGMDRHAKKLTSAMAAMVTGDAPRKVQKRTRATGVAADIVDFFRAKGYPEPVARGIAAGIEAEARSNHGALNPDSGAMGLGQWLGPRKKELIRRYGPNPTRQQQLEFLHHELQGGDPGGGAVRGAKSETAALDAYIRRFMRPAAGAETDGDLARGLAALGYTRDALGEDGGAARFPDLPEEPGLPPRDPALDAAPVAIDGPERLTGDGPDGNVPRETFDVIDGTGFDGPDFDGPPQLRRDMFDDDVSYRIAQAEVDADYHGLVLDRPVASDVTAAPVKATVKPDAVSDFIISPAQVDPVGAPGLSIDASVDPSVFQTVVYRDEAGAPVGGLLIPMTPEAVKNFGGLISYVAPEYRRKGVATALYDYAERRGLPVAALSGTGDMTPAGAALVNARRARGAAGPVASGKIADAMPDDAAARFADPASADAKLQADMLLHDARVRIEAGDMKGLTFETGDGGPKSADVILAALDEEEAALAALEACL